MFLGLDLGTGSVKALLLDTEGGVLDEAHLPYAVRSPRAGWAESSPEEWWEAVEESVRAVLRTGRGDEVAGLGLSGQMHGVVLADGAGRPLRPAVLWADARSREELALYGGLGSEARERLANPLAVGMAGPSLLWLKRHEPGAYRAARWALQPKDWVRLRLTGEAAAEPSDASATLLYDLLSDTWDHPVIEALGLREDLLAPLVPSAARAGTLGRGAARSLGLRPGIPVAAGAADTAAAALGTGLLRAGTAQLTVGTGGQIVVPKDAPDADPSGRTHLYRSATAGRSARWYSMAAVQNAGLALEWVRKVLGASWEDVYREAFSTPPGAGGVRFLPYLSGERTPRFDPSARGAWTGLGLDHGRGHLLRAGLEGVAFALREGVEALEAAGTAVPEPRLAGGGGSGEPWRQLLADVLGRPLWLLPESVAGVASARGAALLAGVASSAYATTEETISLAPEPERCVEPGEAAPVYDEAYASYRELYPRLHGERQGGYPGV